MTTNQASQTFPNFKPFLFKCLSLVSVPSATTEQAFNEHGFDKHGNNVFEVSQRGRHRGTLTYLSCTSTTFLWGLCFYFVQVYVCSRCFNITSRVGSSRGRGVTEEIKSDHNGYATNSSSCRRRASLACAFADADLK